MKNILSTAALVLILAACGNNSGTNDGPGSDTVNNAPITDTGFGTSTDTGTRSGTLNTGDTTGINRDTSRADRTGVNRPTDTARRRSDSLR